MKNKTGPELMAIYLQGEDHCNADKAGDEIYRRLRAFDEGGIVSDYRKFHNGLSEMVEAGRFSFDLMYQHDKNFIVNSLANLAGKDAE